MHSKWEIKYNQNLDRNMPTLKKKTKYNHLKVFLLDMVFY